MKAIILYISLLIFIASQSLNAQNREEAQLPDCFTNGFYNACMNALTPCVTWTDECGDGWIRSHGSPNFLEYTETISGTTVNRIYANMWSEGAIGEGMFRNYNFQTNTTYEINLTLFTYIPGGSGQTSGGGNVEIFAANGLVKADYVFVDGVGCGYYIPQISSLQQIGQYSGMTGELNWTNMTFTFTANANYSQIWIYPKRTAGDKWYFMGLKDIKICKSCNGEIIYNSGVTSPGITRSGTINAGSTAGTSGSGTVTVDGTTTTDFVAAKEINLLSEFEASVTTGSFSAEIVQCSNGNTRVNTGSIISGVIPPKDDQPVKTAANSEREINVYPSVSTGQINITGDLASLENVELSVYDLTGRIVIQLPKKSYPGKATINLNNLNNGTYLLQIKQKGNNITKKIIIQK